MQCKEFIEITPYKTSFYILDVLVSVQSTLILTPAAATVVIGVRIVIMMNRYSYKQL